MLKKFKALFLIAVLFCLSTLIVNAAPDNYAKRKSVQTASEVAQFNSAIGRGKEYGYSSEGLAKYFALGMTDTITSGSVLKTKYYGDWTFTGDGSCSQIGKCFIAVTFKNGEKFTIPLIKDSEGYIVVK